MNTRPFIEVAGRKIGLGYPSFIIAELSCNHLQQLDKAKEIIRAAAAAGADAIKLQTYTADTITIDSRKPDFLAGGADNPSDWNQQTLYGLYQQAYTPWEWHAELKQLIEDLGMIFFSTPSDDTAVDFLEELGTPCYKIASYAATHIPLLEKVAKTHKPVILSTGFATLEEIELAVQTLRENGAQQIALLHCITTYAKDPDSGIMNLRTISDLGERFGVVSGFSDNNAGIEIPIMAVCAGASIVEKHLMLQHADESFDAQFSLDPSELKEMVSRIRHFERLLGQVHYGPANASEEHNLRYRHSIYVVKDMKAGDVFTPGNIRVIRPAFGLAPKHYKNILGKSAKKDIERGTRLSWELIS